MRVLPVVLLLGLLAACDSTVDTSVVEYVAAGRATAVDVAFVAPRGVPAAGDTTFVAGDSTYVAGDTTFVVNVRPTWSVRFEAEQGQPLFLRVTNRTAGATVSAIIYVDEDFFCSDGSGDPQAVVSCGDTL